MDFVETFNISFDKNVRRSYDLFFDVFYATFISKSAEIEAVFANTDLHRQKDMLEQSLLAMINFSSRRNSNSELETLAAIHRNRGVKNELFDLWLDCIVETLESIDAEFVYSEGLAWRVMLSPGIAFMKNYRPPQEI